MGYNHGWASAFAIAGIAATAGVGLGGIGCSEASGPSDSSSVGAVRRAELILPDAGMDAGVAGDKDAGMDAGLESGIIYIHDCAELQEMAHDLFAHYRLAQDIDCAGFDAGDGGGFQPVAHGESG